MPISSLVLILGGAQENTLLTCEDQHRDYGDQVTLITGPAIGPEGTLIPRAQQAGFKLIIMDNMRRSIRPDYEWYSYRELVKLLKELKPDLVHTHSSKAGILGRYAAAAAKILASIPYTALHFIMDKVASPTSLIRLSKNGPLPKQLTSSASAMPCQNSTSPLE